jgi:hypothetical protein
MGKEILGIQARAFHALFIQVGGRCVEDFKRGHQCGGLPPKSAALTTEDTESTEHEKSATVWEFL